MNATHLIHYRANQPNANSQFAASCARLTLRRGSDSISPQGDDMESRLKISSGSSWEAIVGYSRAVRVGAVIEVSGTTATDEDGIFAPGDPYAQTQYALGRIERALIAAGARMEDVIRTRIYVTDISRWEEVARAHAERFYDIRPAATMVEVKALIHPDLVVEIEATAIIDASRDTAQGSS